MILDFMIPWHNDKLMSKASFCKTFIITKPLDIAKYFFSLLSSLFKKMVIYVAKINIIIKVWKITLAHYISLKSILKYFFSFETVFFHSDPTCHRIFLSVTWLPQRSVILQSMLMVLLSTLSVVMYHICDNN